MTRQMASPGWPIFLSLKSYFASARWHRASRGLKTTATRLIRPLTDRPLAQSLASGRAKSPVFLTGPGEAVVPAPLGGAFLLPLESRGDGAPRSASVPYVRTSFSEGAAPLGAPSRRLISAGPRFLTGRLIPAVSELLAGDPSVPGRSPDAARVPGLRRPRPAGAASPMPGYPVSAQSRRLHHVDASR
jgi:hypothetical protein